jgi:hypothetical protein
MAAGNDPNPPAAHTANAKRWFCEPAIGACTMGATKRAMRSLKVIQVIRLKILKVYFACFKHTFSVRDSRVDPND